MIVYLYAALLCAAAAFDIGRLRIPNFLTFGLAGLFFGAALLNASAVAWGSHLLAGLLVLGAGAVLFRLGMFGGGDVKLLAATSLWIGLEGLWSHLLVVALFGGVLALLLLLLRLVVGWLRARSPALRRRPLPRSLIPGEGIPYGVAIAGSALLHSGSVIELEQVLLRGV